MSMDQTVGIISIAALSLSIALVWVPNKHAWIFAYVAFLITALYSSWIEPVAIVSLLVFALVIKASTTRVNGHYRYLINTLVVLCALISGVHLAPGFENIHILDNTRLSENTGWSALRFSADKPSFGLFLLVAYRERLCNSIRQFIDALAKSAPIIVIGTTCVYTIGIFLGFVSLDITLSAVIIVWFFRNLLFTVIAEEMFFRGFIQNKLEHTIKHKYSATIALVIASVLFGSVHLYGGWHYGLLATIAGLMYGYVYQKTGRLEMSFIAHVTLNAGHVVLLSYP